MSSVHKDKAELLSCLYQFGEYFVRIALEDPGVKTHEFHVGFELGPVVFMRVLRVPRIPECIDARERSRLCERTSREATVAPNLKTSTLNTIFLELEGNLVEMDELGSPHEAANRLRDWTAIRERDDLVAPVRPTLEVEVFLHGLTGSSFGEQI
jgi:hypothetical protein